MAQPDQHTKEKTHMNKHTLIFTICFLFLIITPGFANHVPPSIPIQGYVTGSDFEPIDGNVEITFSIYKEPEGDDTLLFRRTIRVAVDQGYFNIQLGSDEEGELDLVIFRDNDILFLGIAVDEEDEMTPRVPLLTAPYAAYAQYAGDSHTLRGKGPEHFVLTENFNWESLEGIPDDLKDGDDDTLVDFSCSDAEILKWNDDSWECSIDDNLLAEINCDEGKILKREGDSWVCSVDNDSLAEINCDEGKILKREGDSWICGDDEILNENQVEEFITNEAIELAEGTTIIGATPGVPIGIIAMWSGGINDIPEGWALCDGNNGTPNLSGRFIVGYKADAPDYDSIGDTGGEKRHQITVAEMPVHSHTGNTGEAGRHTHNIEYNEDEDRNDQDGHLTRTSFRSHTHDYQTEGSGNHGHSFTTNTKGGDGAHENRPPFFTLAYIIKL